MNTPGPAIKTKKIAKMAKTILMSASTLIPDFNPR